MLAIIPARAGSKGLPGKNIKDLMGKPLIGYTIEAATLSKHIEKIIVSTDDEEIAEISKEYGANVPFLKKKELATDSASAIDVYIDTIERLGESFEKQPFMVLLPTVPFRNSLHIDEAYSLFIKKQAKTLVSVTQADVPASWYLSISGEGLLYSAGYGLKNGNILNRQDNAISYIPNGAIYILDYSLLKEKRTYYCDRTIPYIMNKKTSIDIDTLEDFEYAEYILQRQMNIHSV